MPQADPWPLAPRDPVDAFSEVLHQVYAASAEPQRWTEALAAIAAHLASSRALLFTPFVGPERGGLLFPWRIEQQHLAVWASRYIEHDIWALEAQQRGLWQEGAVLIDSDMVPEPVFRASVFYREFLSRIDIARVCVGVIFGGSPGLPSTSLSVFRGPDEPAFGAAERQAMQRLVPHLSRALGLMHRLSRARHQTGSLRAALDRLGIAVFLLDANLRLCHANRAGHEVLARGDGLCLDAGGHLSADLLAGTAGPRLEHWLGHCSALAQADRGGVEASVQLVRRDPTTRYSLQWCALEDNDPLLRHEGARHVVFVSDPQRVELPSSAHIQQRLGLSAGEARVALALVKGDSYKAVAKTLKVSEETVRSHVKAIYAKTRTHGKLALAHLVLSLGEVGV